MPRRPPIDPQGLPRRLPRELRAHALPIDRMSTSLPRALRGIARQVRLADARLGAHAEPPSLRDSSSQTAGCPKECASCTAGFSRWIHAVYGQTGKGHLFRHALLRATVSRTTPPCSAHVHTSISTRRRSASVRARGLATGAATAATIGLEQPRPFHRPERLLELFGDTARRARSVYRDSRRRDARAARSRPFAKRRCSNRDVIRSQGDRHRHQSGD